MWKAHKLVDSFGKPKYHCICIIVLKEDLLLLLLYLIWWGGVPNEASKHQMHGGLTGILPIVEYDFILRHIAVLLYE